MVKFLRFRRAVVAHRFARLFVVWIVSAMICGLPACSKRADVQPEELGYDYFPLETGAFCDYDVTDTTFTLSAPPLAAHYQLREIVQDTFTDGAGIINYRIERYLRQQAGDPWVIDSVWTARRTVNQAIRAENNVPFIKLVFPVREGLTWNGNAFNVQGEDDYQMKGVNKPFTVNGQNFPQTITVWESNDSSLVSQDTRVDVYARSVGLIYLERVIVQYCQDDDCLGQGIINFGTKRIQKIISYGKQ